MAEPSQWPPPPLVVGGWTQPAATDAVERQRLAGRAEGLGTEVLVLLVFVPYGFFLLLKALRVRRELELRGMPVPGATKAAIGCGAASALWFLLALAAGVAALLWMALEPPRLWIANGLDETVRVTIDDRDQGRLELGRPRSFEVRPGRRRLCVRPLGGEPSCASRDLGRREALLWNPGGHGRFVRGLTHYRTPPLEPRPDEVTFVPRGEWLSLAGIDHFFELPPEEVDTGAAEARREWIQQAFSSPVIVFLDNATGLPVEVEADGVAIASLPPGQWVSARLREGPRRLVVRQGEAVLVDLQSSLRDFGTYMLDCTGGRVDYVDNTYDGDALVESRPLTPAALHDVSSFESVFGQRAARAEWIATLGGPSHRLELP